MGLARQQSFAPRCSHSLPAFDVMSVKFAPIYGVSTGPPPAITGSAGEDVDPVWNNGVCLLGEDGGMQMGLAASVLC